MSWVLTSHQILVHVFFKITLWGKHYYYPHFMKLGRGHQMTSKQLKIQASTSRENSEYTQASGNYPTRRGGGSQEVQVGCQNREWSKGWGSGTKVEIARGRGDQENQKRAFSYRSRDTKMTASWKPEQEKKMTGWGVQKALRGTVKECGVGDLWPNSMHVNFPIVKSVSLTLDFFATA